MSEASKRAPDLDVIDEYQARHRVWAIADQSQVAMIQSLMGNKKLLIADGHHRYETALGYAKDHPDDEAAQYVVMAFFNMHAPGLKILATHRVLRGIDPTGFHERAKEHWSATPLHSIDELKRALAVAKSVDGADRSCDWGGTAFVGAASGRRRVGCAGAAPAIFSAGCWDQ